MRIFDRYIIRQILVSTLLAVVVLSAVLVLGQIFKKLLDLLVAGVLPLSAIPGFIALAFPASLAYTLPWGLLTGVLLTFGRLSADNELVSLRMSGLSLGRICLPVFLVAAAFSGLCLWINTVVAPYSLRELNAMTRQAAVRDPRVLFAPDKVVDAIPGHLIYAGDRQGDDMDNVQIFILETSGDKAGRPSGIIFAKKGTIITDDIAETQTIEFGATGNTWFVRREAQPLTEEEAAGRTPEQIAAHNVRMAREAAGPPRIFDFGTTASGIPFGIKSLIDNTTAVKADRLTTAELRDAMRDPSILGRERLESARAEARFEYNRRFSFALACFVLALAGIPFGISAHRRETSSGFVLSLIVGIGYFSLIMLGSLWKTKPEKFPYLVIWLPNVVFGVMGIVLFRRLARR